MSDLTKRLDDLERAANIREKIILVCEEGDLFAVVCGQPGTNIPLDQLETIYPAERFDVVIIRICYQSMAL